MSNECHLSTIGLVSISASGFFRSYQMQTDAEITLTLSQTSLNIFNKTSDTNFACCSKIKIKSQLFSSNFIRNKSDEWKFLQRFFFCNRIIFILNAVVFFKQIFSRILFSVGHKNPTRWFSVLRISQSQLHTIFAAHRHKHTHSFRFMSESNKS